jgi:hypothetical protein
MRRLFKSDIAKPETKAVIRTGRIDRSRRVFCTCRQNPGHAPTSSSLGAASEYVPLLGKERLEPIDYRAHAGGAANAGCAITLSTNRTRRESVVPSNSPSFGLRALAYFRF